MNLLLRMQRVSSVGLLCATLLLATANAAPQLNKPSDKIVLCHFTSWSVYNEGRAKHDVEDINATLCTHILYHTAGLDHNNHIIQSLDPWNDLDINYGHGAFGRFTALCKKAGAVSLLSIGGWNEGSKSFSDMASSAETRKTFIDSVIQFLNKFQFQGLNIDWEYPTLRGGKPEDRVNFPLLLKETKTAFAAHGFILSASVSTPPGHAIDEIYDLPAISKWVDMLDLMATISVIPSTITDNSTHHHTALNKHPLDKGNYTHYNVRYVVDYCLEKGADASKILLGVSTMGYKYTLKNPDTDRGLYAETDCSVQSLPYNEICLDQTKENWLITRDKHLAAPYGFYSGNQWCAYEEKYSIANKMDLVLEKHLGGASVYELASDNFSGDCKLGKYPLLTTVAQQLHAKAGA